MTTPEQNSTREKVRTHPQFTLQTALAARTGAGKKHRTANASSVPMGTVRGHGLYVVRFIMQR